MEFISPSDYPKFVLRLLFIIYLLTSEKRKQLQRMKLCIPGTYMYVYVSMHVCMYLFFYMYISFGSA